MMPRTLRLKVMLAGMVVVLVCGCSRKIREYTPSTVYRANEVVARVDRQKMIWDQLDKQARNYMREDVESKSLYIPPGGDEKMLGFFRRRALALFVNKTVLLGEAKKRGIAVTPADRQKFVMEMERLLKERSIAASLDDFFKKSPLGEKETRREFEDGLIIDKFINECIRPKITIVEQDREALANEIIAKRREAKQKADELRLQIQKGADFATLAKELSSTDKRIVGGDVGEITRGKYGDKQIEDAIFRLKVNEISPVLETPRSYLLVRVTAHTAAKAAAGATPARPETVRASVINVRAPSPPNSKEMERIIQERKFGQAMTDLLQSLRAKAKIETIYKDLVF